MADREIALPFRLDARGRVASTTSPDIIGRQHLTTFLLTQPGERLMRPDFGTPIRETVFEPLDEVTAQLLLVRVQERVAASVGSVAVKGLTSRIDSAESALRLTVEFALAVGTGEGDTRSTTITLGGDEQ